MRKSTLDYIDEKIKELSAEDRTKLDDRLIGLMVEDSAHKKLKYELDFGPDYIDEAMEMYNNFGKFQGMSTGYKSLDTFTKGLVGGELVIIGGATSGGKQQPVNEIIPTPLGDKRFGDLKVGDYVFGSDGKPITVTGIFPQGVMPIYRVWFSDMSYLDTGKNHLWTLERIGRKSRVLTSAEMMDKLPSSNYHIPTVEPLEYSDVSEPIPAYELGMYIADGSMCGKSLRITKSAGDVSDYLQSLDGELKRYDHPSTCGYLYSNSKSKISRYMFSCGLANMKSHEKFIPKEWFTKTYDIRLRLLRGLMDGDGSYLNRPANKHCTTMYHSTSEQLIDDITRLATSIGWIVRKGIVKHRNGNYFRLTFHSTNFTNPFLMSKESKLWSALDKEVKRRVTRVEIVGEDDAMCISVDAHDELYVADTRFNIVTHNTSIALNIAGNVMKSGKSVLVVTLEMTKPQVISRMMIADKNFLDYSANLVFQKHDEFSWEDIDGIIENAKVNMNIDLVVVDHLHHFTRELRNTSEDIGRITKEFQKNAKRHKVPIILISHTRKGEGKGIDELRSSSYIAQDADIVLMVYRDRDYPGKIGVAIEKNRNRGYDFDNNSVLLNFDRTRIYEDYEQY